MVPLWLMKFAPIAMVAIGTLLLARNSKEDEDAKTPDKRGNRRSNRDSDRRTSVGGGRGDGTGGVDVSDGMEPSKVGADNRRGTGNNHGGKQGAADPKRGAAKLLEADANTNTEDNGDVIEEPSTGGGDDDGNDVPGQSGKDAVPGNQNAGE